MEILDPIRVGETEPLLARIHADRTVSPYTQVKTIQMTKDIYGDPPFKLGDFVSTKRGMHQIVGWLEIYRTGRSMELLYVVRSMDGERSLRFHWWDDEGLGAPNPMEVLALASSSVEELRKAAIPKPEDRIV